MTPKLHLYPITSSLENSGTFLRWAAISSTRDKLIKEIREIDLLKALDGPIAIPDSDARNSIYPNLVQGSHDFTDVRPINSCSLSNNSV